MNDAIFQKRYDCRSSDFNGQGVASYARVDLLHAHGGAAPTQRCRPKMFDDRKAAPQAFDINQADQLGMNPASGRCPACFNTAPGDGDEVVALISFCFRGTRPGCLIYS
jgi:hypothetical protein